MISLDVGIAVGGFDAPDAQHYRAIDADVLLDAREERSIFLRLHLPGLDAPLPVEVLPQLLAEFGLIALEIEHLGVGFEALHHVRISRVRHAPRPRSRAKQLDPIAEILAACLRLRRGAPSAQQRAKNEAHG